MLTNVLPTTNAGTPTSFAHISLSGVLHGTANASIGIFIGAWYQGDVSHNPYWLRNLMTEKAKRIAPTSNTLRQLFLRSGNLCAYPGCNHLMMDTLGNFVGQICHIEAASEGGERFNPLMSNEERRSAANLMLMCYRHHVETNNVASFTVQRMRQIKADHESKFSDASHAMLQSIRDWTADSQNSGVKNLKQMSHILQLGLDDAELQLYVNELNEYLVSFVRVPLNVRHFLGKLAVRMQEFENKFGLYKESGHEFLPVSDIQSAFRISYEEINGLFSQMSNYNLGNLIEVSCDGVLPPHGAFLHSLPSGWDFWSDVAKFCIKTSADIEVITNLLNFDILDLDTSGN